MRVYDHTRRLAHRGNDVYLVTRGIDGVKQDEEFEGIHVRRSAYTFRGGTFLNKVRLMLEQMLMIITLQRKEHFSVIHVHGFTSGLAALPCKYLFGVPVVITTHGTELLWPRKLWWMGQRTLTFILIFEKFILNHCDVVIAQSRSEGVHAKDLRFPAREQGFRLVHTGVDQEKFHVPPKEEGMPQVLFVGALSDKGGHVPAEHVRGRSQGRPKHAPGARGQRAEGTRVQEVRAEPERGGHDPVQRPRQGRRPPAQLYRESDIVVLPSNVGGPISCTVLEGLSCGKAVISTDVPGGIATCSPTGWGY